MKKIKSYDQERKSTLKERLKFGFEKFKSMSFKDLMVTILLLAPYALLFIVFIAVPVAIAVCLSLTNFNVVETPSFAGFINYITLLTQDELFLKYVLPNTIEYAIIVGPIGYILSFIIAWM